MTGRTEYEDLLSDEGITHDDVLAELDELVQSGQLERRFHRVILSALEVASGT